MSRLAEEGFARAALQSGCRFSAGLAGGRALVGPAEARALMATGRAGEAEHVLATLVAPNERGEVTLALVRARNLFFALNRSADAEAALRAGEDALGVRGLAGGPASLSAMELHALRARFAFAQGDPRTALAM